MGWLALVLVLLFGVDGGTPAPPLLIATEGGAAKPYAATLQAIEVDGDDGGAAKAEAATLLVIEVDAGAPAPDLPESYEDRQLLENLDLLREYELLRVYPLLAPD